MLSSTIWSKFPFLKTNKLIILFVVKALFIYCLLLLCYFGYVGLADPNGNYNLSDTLGKFDLINIITQGLIYPAKFILNLMGYKTITHDNCIAILGSGGIRIAFPCLGIKTWISFTALILAYPNQSSLWLKISYILFGIFIFHCINIIRMVILTWVNQHPSNHYAFDIHHDVFNVVVYLIIFLMFYLWIKRGERGSSKFKVEG